MNPSPAAARRPSAQTGVAAARSAPVRTASFRLEVLAAWLLAASCLALGAARAEAAGAPPAADARDEVRRSQSGLDSLARGHWIEVRGRLDASGRFVATRVELRRPGRREVWWGTPDAVPDRHGRFLLLGRTVQTNERTRWDEITPDAIVGRRIKVTGDVLGERLLARRIAARRPGVDRIEGRIDRVRALASGRGWPCEASMGMTAGLLPTASSIARPQRADCRSGLELTVSGFRVIVPAELEVTLDEQVVHPRRIAARASTGASIYYGPDDDDILGPGYRFNERAGVAIQQELSTRDEDEFDLDPRRDRNRDDQIYRLRTRFTWEPSWRLGLVAEAKYRYRERDREDRELRTDSRLQLGEAYLIARDLGLGFDLQVGRQDFDEPREWLYDQNLDAVRLIRRRGALNLELSASTTLSDGSRRDEAADNFVLYVSNLYARRHLAAYVVHRRFDLAPAAERRTHVGIRALGEFVPGLDSWLELSHLSGELGGRRLDAWGGDLGAVIEPDALGPFRLVVGYAYGSGDDGAGDDGTFRQTGLQDNDAFLSGVTSLRYYGELLNPELSNLEIVTAGIGLRPHRNLSLELIAHRYRQVRASRRLLEADLDRRPDGISRDLGTELDLVAGLRLGDHWRLEAVAATFREGAAFPRRGGSAELLKLQLRYRH